MPSTALLNSDVLESFRELQSEDDPHFVREYFKALLDSLFQHLSDLEVSIATQNYAKIATHAHAIKSTCANAGINQISGIAETLEKLGNDRSGQIPAGMFDELQRLCEQVKVEILSLPELKSS